MINSLSLLLDFNSPLLVLCLMDLWDCCRVFRLLQSLLKMSLLEEFKPLSSLQFFADALLNDDSDQALRPKDPSLLLAFAEAAQHGMQACVPKTTDAKNKTGWRLWEQFLQDIGGNTPPLRQPDLNPRHMLREQLLKNMFILWCRTKCSSSLPGRITCKPGSLLAHLYAVKREHEVFLFPH